MVTASTPVAPVAGPAPDPPGPRGLLWFGSQGEVRANPMRFYTRLANEYGGIARFFYGRKPTYLISEPDLIREFLVERRELYVKNTRYALLVRAIGNGLLNSDGQTWQEQRTASQPGFSRSRIHAQVGRTVAIATTHVERWERWADTGEPHDIEPDMSVLIQDLIGHSLLGPVFGEIGERFVALVEEIREHWPPTVRTLLGHLRPPPLRQMRHLKGLLDDLDGMIFAAIREQRASGEANDSLLSILARAEVGEGGRGFDDQSLRDQLLTLYFAGFETSASTLTFLLYRLSLQPEIRDRLYGEVAALDGRRPERADLKSLGYTEQCLHETLRIYPPAYNFSRVMLEDTTVGGYRVAKDSMVIVSPYATHRLPRWWPNPEGFDPDRFSEERAAGRSQFAYIPFGAGHRYCIGGPLALVQMKLITAVIAQRYRLDVKPGHPVEPIPGTVMRPEQGMPMLIRAEGSTARAARRQTVPGA
jgi:cytochrome P450